MARLRTLSISAELFVNLFTKGDHPAYSVTENHIPDGTVVRNARLGWPQKVELLLESPEFDDLKDGEMIPEIIPVITVEDGEVAKA